MVRISGIAKADRKTKALVSQLTQGSIAVIDHEDLDEVAAESIVNAKVKAVVNAAKTLSGRYPAPGAEIILRAGIILIDNVGEDIFCHREIDDDPTLLIDNGNIFINGQHISTGRQLTIDEVQQAMQQARQNLTMHLDAFVLNTIDFARKERDLILGKVQFPTLKTGIQNKPAVVVVRGPGYIDDLTAIASYIEEVGPVIVAVDGGADALHAQGFQPDIIIGDMDSVTDAALKSGAELIVHAYPDGKAPGMDRLRKLNLTGQTIASAGTSEDLALLMLYELGASVIVAVGTHTNIVDFFEKGRKGMAGTFLVRLKVGSILIDAKGLSQIYRGAPKKTYPYIIAVAALLPLTLIIFLSEALWRWMRLAVVHLRLWAGI